jgi:hypothetical protein
MLQRSSSKNYYVRGGLLIRNVGHNHVSGHKKLGFMHTAFVCLGYFFPFVLETPGD